MYYLLVLVAGFGGGAIRGIIGFVKHQFSYKSVKFDIPYFLAMTFISGAVGALTALAVKETGIKFLGSEYFSPALSLIVGYAGGDFLENIYKIVIKKSTLYSEDQE